MADDALVPTPEAYEPKCARLAREAIIATITTDAAASSELGVAHAAITMAAVLPQTTALSTQERGLMHEWLDRIAEG